MSDSRATRLTTLFDEVRLLDHRLVQVAERLHARSDVSVPGRAVLEFLEREGPTSVPDVARARYVSRQHIQTIVDAVTERGLVRRVPNPAHRRSPLFTLTPAGARAIESMHERERDLLDERMAAIDERSVEAAAAVLAAVRVALDDTREDLR